MKIFEIIEIETEGRALTPQNLLKLGSTYLNQLWQGLYPGFSTSLTWYPSNFVQHEHQL